MTDLLTKKAIETIISFRDKYLNHNIEELKTFSFWKIKDDPDYNGYKGEYDGDRTNIVYAIDYLLYKDSNFPKFSLRGYPCTTDEEANYSGDTINTYRTLFGKFDNEKIIEKKFKFTSSEIQKKQDFFYTYQMLGNFTLLPKSDINRLRGKFWGWKDYYDLFLLHLDNCLYPKKELSSLEKSLSLELKKTIPSLFFKKNPETKDFTEAFHMKEYQTVNYEHPLIDGINHSSFGKNPSEENRFLYKKFAFNYIDKATEYIENRTLILVDLLKEKYPTLSQK